MARKPTICLDFDGTLHLYTSPWGGAQVIPDGPTPGAREAVEELVLDGWRVIVLSARAQTLAGTEAIKQWLRMWRIPFDDVTAIKPSAVVYVDDRALRFTGNWAHILLEVRRLAPRKAD
jgi:hypothetical protein